MAITIDRHTHFHEPTAVESNFPIRAGLALRVVRHDDHNDANVCALGARQHSQQEVLELVKIFIGKDFSNDERHVRRIGKITSFEQSGEIVY